MISEDNFSTNNFKNNVEIQYSWTNVLQLKTMFYVDDTQNRNDDRQQTPTMTSEYFRLQYSETPQ